MKFTPEIFQNLELTDPDLFVTSCQEFFKAHSFKGRRVLVVLDSTIIFTKRIELTNSHKDSVRDEIEHYAAQIPFDSGQRAVIYLQNDRLLQIFAVNALIFQGIQEALKNTGVRKFAAITPAAAYQIDYSAKPAEVIDQFLDDTEVLKVLDFSTSSIR